MEVYIPHKEFWLCCFLTLSLPIDAILASFNVLVLNYWEEDNEKLGYTTLLDVKATKITFLPLQLLPNFAWA